MRRLRLKEVKIIYGLPAAKWQSWNLSLGPSEPQNPNCFRKPVFSICLFFSTLEFRIKGWGLHSDNGISGMCSPDSTPWACASRRPWDESECGQYNFKTGSLGAWILTLEGPPAYPGTWRLFPLLLLGFSCVKWDRQCWAHSVTLDTLESIKKEEPGRNSPYG